MTNCAKCGAELEQPTTGRPPRYCSPSCRRLAEFERRRVVRRLESLEDEAARARLELNEETRIEHRGALGDLNLTPWQRDRLTVYLSKQEVLLRRATSEIDRLESRLAVLVDVREGEQ